MCLSQSYRYYPKGGGHCIVNVRPVKCLNAINLVDCGDVSRIFGWSFVAGSLPIHVRYVQYYFMIFIPIDCCNEYCKRMASF